MRSANADRGVLYEEGDRVEMDCCGAVGVVRGAAVEAQQHFAAGLDVGLIGLSRECNPSW